MVVNDPHQESEINVYSQHWNTAKDSLNIFLHMRLPLNQFVFRKSTDHFFSNVIYTLVISNTEKDIQVYRESWNEKVTQPFYEDTRNPDNYFITERNIALATGTYKIFLNIQDKDSRRNLQINKEYKLEPIHVLGPILPFIQDENLQKIVSINNMENKDTIWLRTQVLLQDSIPDQIIYKVRLKETIIDSGKVNLLDMDDNQLYYIPIPFMEYKHGWYKITLNYHGEIQSASFNFGSIVKRYWTDDVDELIGVMRYIISDHSEYNQLRDMDKLAMWEYIDEYWKEKDPSPKTPENELLNQINERVKFVNKNFSILKPGWRSDRGRIYIIYGPPQNVDESYQDQMGYNYLKWIYPSGKQFIFIDRSMSGDYSLYREMY